MFLGFFWDMLLNLCLRLHGAYDKISGKSGACDKIQNFTSCSNNKSQCSAYDKIDNLFFICKFLQIVREIRRKNI